MSQKLFTITFLLINIALSHGLQLRPTFNVMSEIKSVENSEFGKKLMDTVQLQLGNKAPLEDVAKLLNDLKSNLLTQQADANDLHQKREKQCADNIAALNHRIKTASFNMKDAADQIATFEQNVEQLQAQIATKETQQSILTKRSVSLETNHKQDNADFARRSKEHTEVLEALVIIIDKLQNIPDEPAKKDAVFAELAKIGKSNPIGALVQVAASLDKDSLTNVINKLSEIKNSIEASLNDDRTAQAAALQSYNTLREETANVLVQVKNELVQLRDELAENQQNLKEQQERLKEQTEEFNNATAEKKAEEEKCENWRQVYAREKKQRSEEVSVVEKVQSILATKLSSMKGYLKERVNK